MFTDTSGGTDSKKWRVFGLDSDFRIGCRNDANSSGQTAYEIIRSGATISNHRFSTSGSERMRLTDTGLGIGTSSPSEKLHVEHTGNTLIKSKTTTSTALGGFEAHSSGGTSYIKIHQLGPSFGGTTFGGVTGNDQSLIEAQAASSLTFSTQGGTPDIIFAPARTNRMIIKNDGKVGIGVTNPAVTMELSGNGGAIRLPTGGELQFGDANNLILGNSGSDYLMFKTNGSERMRIFSGGNVSIGTTSDPTKLAVSNGSSSVSPHNLADELFIENNGDTGFTIGSSTSGTGNIMFGDSGDPNRGRIRYHHSTDKMEFGTSGLNDKLVIDSSGSVGIGTASPFNSRPGSLTVSNDTPTIYLEDTNASGREVGQILYNDTNLTFSIGDRNGTGTTNSLELLKINNAGKIFTRQTAQFDDCVTIGGSPFTGDFQIEVSGLNAVNGGSHKSIGMRLSMRGIAGDATNGINKDLLLFISGLSSWSSVGSIDTGGSTVGITVNSATTTAVTFTITSPASTAVGAYVATLFANDNSTMECNG